MKFLTKMTLLSFSMASILVHAESAKYQDCEELEGGKSCLAFQITVPNYSAYPWLTDFVLPETFDEEDTKLADLQALSERYVKSVLTESEAGNDVETITWNPVEEAGDYLQISKNELIKSSSEDDPIENTSYYVFNKKDHHQPLSLDDILVSKAAEEKLSEALKSIYLTWQTQHNASQAEAKDILNNFLENDEMVVSDNWFIAKDMIVFNYGASEIGPPSYGNINLAVPTNGLEGIIKPEILQATAQWTVKFNAKK